MPKTTGFVPLLILSSLVYGCSWFVVDMEGRPCPCIEGYTCCDGTCVDKKTCELENRAFSAGDNTPGYDIQSNIGGGDKEALFDVVIDSKGRILAVGMTRTSLDNHGCFLLRYTNSGELDKSFGANRTGIVRGPEAGYGGKNRDWCYAVEVDSQDRVLIGGSTLVFEEAGNTQSLVFVARYTEQGQLDVSFSDNTTPGYYLGNADSKSSFTQATVHVDEVIRDIKVHNNKIAAVGHVYEAEIDSVSQTLLFRLTEDGDLDSTCGGSGYQLGGRSVLGGDGCTDEFRSVSYSDAGIFAAGSASASAVTDPCGTLVHLVAMYKNDCQPDTQAFDQGVLAGPSEGRAQPTEPSGTKDHFHGVLRDLEQKYITVGVSQNGYGDYKLLVQKYSKQNQEHHFLGNVTSHTSSHSEWPYDVAQDSKGRIIIAGFDTNEGLENADVFLAAATGRLLVTAMDNGSIVPIPAFGVNGVFFGPISQGGSEIARAVAVDRFDDIVVVGESDGHALIFRLTPKGQLDAVE